MINTKAFMILSISVLIFKGLSYFYTFSNKSTTPIIDIHKATQNEIETSKSWPIWTKEISEFDYSYDQTEQCMILEGEVDIKVNDNKIYSFKSGDFVTFPKGLKCKWIIKQPVKKHYKFS